VVESMIPFHRHELGYEFSSTIQHGQNDHTRLDVTLHLTPTEKHFDPKLVFFLVSDDEEIEHLTITYNGLHKNKYRVVAGLVRIQDRKGKVVFAFTFGGDLQIEKEGQEKICTLISKAPILQFNRPPTIRFIVEVEIFLAKRRAFWGSTPDEFEKRLASVEPHILYKACLEYILEKFIDSFRENSMHLKYYLQAKLHILHNEHKLPGYSPPLRELI